MTTVALVTDRVSLPIDYDMPLLREACTKVGLDTEVCQWEDPEVDWARFDAVVLRSPWNYVDQLPDFLAWCQRVEEATLLLNPLAVARWALDKSYLADLAALGVPVVPSRFASSGDDPDVVVREVLDKHRDAMEIVVKPGIGAYSRNVRRFPGRRLPRPPRICRSCSARAGTRSSSRISSRSTGTAKRT